jgi:hypothetical protein
MAYLRCTACGSKALVAASQCPRCAHPFRLLSSRGDRVKLSRCRGCGIMHRFDATCHWCGVLPRAAWQSPAVWRTAAALVLSVTVAGAAWRYGSPLGVELLQRLNAAPLAFQQVATTDRVATGPTSLPVAAIVTDIAAAVVAPMIEVESLALSSAAGADSITWTPAVARTWVNVRNDASRGSVVVGVIKPAARAMLGTDRAGWRQVRSPDVITGWVDPRLFEPDSLRSRGE